MWPLALLARTRALLARALPDDALETIRLARDSHPVRRPSFAFDVVGGATIEALLQTDELDQARRVAREHEDAGVLTALATVRLLLRERSPDAASAELLRLQRDPSLGPGARIECRMLAVWAEFLREGDLDAAAADQLFRVMRRRDHRRLAAGVPRQVVECAQERLAEESAQEFAEARGGLVHTELGERPVLTAGERRVLEGLTVHTSTAAMATAFQVSPNTIKSQLRTLYRKLGCSTREEALRAAERLHLLMPEGE
jgi:ATP/maltotriose-dependent transcriptional regulator MalT